MFCDDSTESTVDYEQQKSYICNLYFSRMVRPIGLLLSANIDESGT